MPTKAIIRQGEVSLIDTAVTDVTAIPLLEPGAQLMDESTRQAVRATATAQITAETLDDATVEALAGAFDPWIEGEAVAVGALRSHGGTVVECIQAHTTQADWTPDVTPALWKVHRTPGMTEWVAGISVEVGEEFTYEGTTYRVLQAHTTQVGWEPPNVPALWEAV